MPECPCVVLHPKQTQSCNAPRYHIESLGGCLASPGIDHLRLRRFTAIACVKCHDEGSVFRLAWVDTKVYNSIEGEGT